MIDNAQRLYALFSFYPNPAFDEDDDDSFHGDESFEGVFSSVELAKEYAAQWIDGDQATWVPGTQYFGFTSCWRSVGPEDDVRHMIIIEARLDCGLWQLFVGHARGERQEHEQGQPCKL